MSFVVIIRHGGHFGENSEYKGGYMHDYVADLDKWSYFEAVGIVRELGYNNEFILWWWSDVAAFMGGYKSFRGDRDAIKAAEFALKHNCGIYLYVESLETEDAEVEKGLNSDSDDDGTKGIHFNDSEEERALGLNDELGDDESDGHRGQPSHTTLENDNDDDSLDEDFEPSADVLEDEYQSEELVSSDGEDENEGQRMVRYPVFNKAALDKNYEFQIGMEFRTHTEFKDAILEHAILNGKQLKIKKTDKKRVQVKCKFAGKCQFQAYLSREGQRHTYRLTTFDGKHTCGRVFNNKNANAKWVSKLVAEKLVSSDKVKITEVMTDVRRKYATGITVSRAWRAIKLAREVVEGDAARQYTLLWNYSAELRNFNRKYL